MSKKLLFSFAAGAVALASAACAAVASPLDVGATFTASGANPLTVPVRFGGGGGFHGGGGFGGIHGGGFGGFHGGAFHGGNFGRGQFAGRSPFTGRMLARSRFDHGNFRHGHGRRHRFFFAGYPYFYYDDDDYDDNYGDNCLWSRRYHRWACPDY